jgi:hypothetical protein
MWSPSGGKMLLSESPAMISSVKDIAISAKTNALLSLLCAIGVAVRPDSLIRCLNSSPIESFGSINGYVSGRKTGY